MSYYNPYSGSGERASPSAPAGDTRSYQPYGHVRTESGAGLGAPTAVAAPAPYGYADSVPPYASQYTAAGAADAGQYHRRGQSGGSSSGAMGRASHLRGPSNDYNGASLGAPSGSNLMRSDTLLPTDSISKYNYDMEHDDEEEMRGAANMPVLPRGQHAPSGSRSGFPAYPTMRADADADDRHVRRSSATYYEDDLYGGAGKGSYHHNGAADVSSSGLPLRAHGASMGYADDEEDEGKQLAREPILFSNMAKGSPEDDYYGQDGYYGGGAAGAYGDAPGGARSKATGFLQNATSDLLGLKRGQDPALGPYGHPRGSLGEAIEKRRQGIRRQRYAPVSYLFAAAYVAAFAAELIRSAATTGSPIQTHPTFNPWIGPTPEFLISFGARFVPCMRSIPQVDPSTARLPCLKYSNANNGGLYQQNELCTLADLCGLSNPTQPNQQWRLVTPIFLHGGVVHILFNLLAQVFICTDTEKILGSAYYTLVYLLGGIGGNLLGASFGLVGLPAVGASGSIFACIAVEITDLIYNWKYEARPTTRLTLAIFFTILSLGLGLLPYSDNFSHIGGAAVGLLGGLIFGPSVHPSKMHRGATWATRIICLVLLVGFFVGLALNYVRSDDPTKACKWCRYLSCLPTFSQCKDPLNGIQTGTSTGSGSGTFSSSAPASSSTNAYNFGNGN